MRVTSLNTGLKSRKKSRTATQIAWEAKEEAEAEEQGEREEGGLSLTDVNADSPAGEGGLRAGDV
jgi:hypothetical protein